MDENIVKNILTETEAGYDEMSEKFSQTRKFFWRGMEFIGDYVKEGDRVLDFGSGNGRLIELFTDKKIEYFGIDPSQKLVDLAQEKYLHPHIKTTNQDACNFNVNENKDSNFGVGASTKFSKLNLSQSSLPLEDNFFNSIYSIAVFHHFPSIEYRKKMAEELYRVTKNNGHIVITAWNLWQKNYIKNIFQNWWGKILSKSKLDWNDCQISFKNNEGKVFSRFHHAFTKRELRKLFEVAGFKTEMCKIINGRNILYIGKK